MWHAIIILEFYYAHESGTLVLSFDTLFGLLRKKSAGISHRNSLHGNLLFGVQKAVDEHVLLDATSKSSKGSFCVTGDI